MTDMTDITVSCPKCPAGYRDIAWTGGSPPCGPDYWQCTACGHEWETPMRDAGPSFACPCPCACWAQGVPDDGSNEPGWCHACRMNIHSGDRPRPRPFLAPQ
jgi:hypothetical protein